VGGASHERYAAPSLCTWIPLHHIMTSRYVWRDIITMQDWWRDVTDVIVWKLDRCIQPIGWRDVTSVVRPDWRSSPSSSKVISSATMQNLKIPITFKVIRVAGSPATDHLLRSPDHPLDNLAFILRYKECFFAETCQKHSSCWQFVQRWVFLCSFSFESSF
jgi:hypothetical protein